MKINENIKDKIKYRGIILIIILSFLYSMSFTLYHLFGVNIHILLSLKSFLFSLSLIWGFNPILVKDRISYIIFISNSVIFFLFFLLSIYTKYLLDFFDPISLIIIIVSLLIFSIGLSIYRLTKMVSNNEENDEC